MSDGTKPDLNCQHCDLVDSKYIQCKDCGEWCCIFCALHGVHEQESHAK